MASTDSSVIKADTLPDVDTIGPLSGFPENETILIDLGNGDTETYTIEYLVGILNGILNPKDFQETY
jgi:hypothetical protein